MLELYHFPRAICAQKVRVALAEKRVHWESRTASGALRSPEYLNLNPNGYVPTLVVHDGRVIIESHIINEYIDDAFPQPALLSADPFERAQARPWTKQIDDSLHLNVYVLTFTASFRETYLAMTPAQLDMALPVTTFIKRQYTIDLTEHGYKSPLVAVAVKRFQKLFADMEAVLAKSSWLAGDHYSLADVDFTPYLRRLDELGLWALVCSEHPNVARWYAAVQARPSYQRAILDYVTVDDDDRERRSAAMARPYLTAALRINVSDVSNKRATSSI